MKNIFDIFTMIEQTYETVQRIEAKLKSVDRKEVSIMADLTQIESELAELKVTAQQTEADLVALKNAVIEANKDPARLQAISDNLVALKAELDAANAAAEA